MITSTDFQKVLTTSHVRVSQILQAALMVGPVMFFAAVLAAFATQTDEMIPSPEGLSIINILSVVNLCFLIVASTIGFTMQRYVFSPARLRAVAGESPEVQAGRAAILQRSAMIIRLAFQEGAAFFGLSVCMIGATNGVLQSDQVYWLNLGSLLVLEIVGVLTFPLRDRLIAQFEESFTGAGM